MPKKIFILVLTLALVSLAYTANMSIDITVVYNNVSYNENLTTAWGIACVVKGLEKNILFDTGGDGTILLANMEKLGLDPADIDVVLLSHIHADHTEGLWKFLEVNNQVVVYLPASFPKDFKDQAKALCKEVVEVYGPVEVCSHAWSTGQLGTSIKEQSLVIDTVRGLVVVDGCSHPGVDNIVRHAKDMFNGKNVYLVLGGFHLASYSEGQVRELIKHLKELGVERVGPSHCTGGRAIELFREAWGKDFLDLGCGARVRIEDER